MRGRWKGGLGEEEEGEGEGMGGGGNEVGSKHTNLKALETVQKYTRDGMGLRMCNGFPLVSLLRAVATSVVNPVSTGPLFEATTTFAANIHQFGGVPGRLVSSHIATVDRARD